MDIKKATDWISWSRKVVAQYKKQIPASHLPFQSQTFELPGAPLFSPLGGWDRK